MVFNFQVIFRLPAWPAPQVLPVEAETAQLAAQRIRELYPQEEKTLLITVGPATEPPWFAEMRILSTGATAEEAQQLLNLTRTGLWEAQTKGLLRRPKTTRGIVQIPMKDMVEFNEVRTEIRNTEKAAA